MKEERTLQHLPSPRPTLREMPLWLGSHWWPLWAFPLATAIVLLCVWLWRGRDDRASLPPLRSHLPPLELSPAQVGTLIDNMCNPRDISATLVDLAARGFIAIEEVRGRDILLSRGDLRFTRCDSSPPHKRLRSHERLFLRALFDPQPPDIERGKRPANTNILTEPWNETALSLLKNKFYRHRPEIEKEIYASLMREGFFFSDPQAIMAFFSVVGAQLFMGGLYTLHSLERNPRLTFDSGATSFPLGIMLSGALWLYASRFMPAKTALGTRRADQCKTFVAWVKSVPVVVLQGELARDAGLFERLLPYAIVLGVGPQWAQKCGQCGAWAPLWFDCDISHGQDAQNSVTRLLADLPRIEQVFASAPEHIHHEEHPDY